MSQEKANEKAFPWVSAISLLYPISAMIYVSLHSPAPTTLVIGYGVANLGYLLFAAGLFSGTFKIFKLEKRWKVFLLAIVLFSIGTFLSSIGA